MMRPTLLWYLDDCGEKASGGTAVDGVPIEYTRKGNTMYGARLMSAEPQHYLDSRFVPGVLLSGRNQAEH